MHGHALMLDSCGELGGWTPVKRRQGRVAAMAPLHCCRCCAWGASGSVWGAPVGEPSPAACSPICPPPLVPAQPCPHLLYVGGRCECVRQCNTRQVGGVLSLRVHNVDQLLFTDPHLHMMPHAGCMYCLRVHEGGEVGWAPSCRRQAAYWPLWVSACSHAWCGQRLQVLLAVWAGAMLTWPDRGGTQTLEVCSTAEQVGKRIICIPLSTVHCTLSPMGHLEPGGCRTPIPDNSPLHHSARLTSAVPHEPPPRTPTFVRSSLSDMLTDGSVSIYLNGRSGDSLLQNYCLNTSLNSQMLCNVRVCRAHHTEGAMPVIFLLR